MRFNAVQEGLTDILPREKRASDVILRSSLSNMEIHMTRFLKVTSTLGMSLIPATPSKDCGHLASLKNQASYLWDQNLDLGA